jgi:hypothetical protein
VSCVNCYNYSTWKFLAWWLYIQSVLSHRCNPCVGVFCTHVWWFVGRDNKMWCQFDITDSKKCFFVLTEVDKRMTTMSCTLVYGLCARVSDVTGDLDYTYLSFSLHLLFKKLHTEYVWHKIWNTYNQPTNLPEWWGPMQPPIATASNRPWLELFYTTVSVPLCLIVSLLEIIN